MLRWRWATRLLVSTLLALALLVPASTSQAQSDQRCFPETGFCIAGRIRQFWEQNGGLPVFGFPIGPETSEGGRVVQYFERQRFELHPENAAPYDVLLGRLGAEVLARNGVDWQTQPTSPGPAAGCRWFPETRHNVCDQQPGAGFLTAWRQNGLEFDGRAGTSEAESLALFGLPITEAYEDTLNGRQIQVMWFERARFEWHPDNPAAYRVLFGRLGAELQGSPLAAPLPGGAAPPAAGLVGQRWQLATYGADGQPALADAPATLLLDSAGRVSGTTGCNGFGGSYSASGNQITFGQLISTLRACSDAISQQERAILGALQGTVRYEIDSGALRIFDGQGQPALTYRAAPTASVTGTVTYRERLALAPGATVTVRLLDISRQDAPAAVLSEQAITTTGQQVPIPFSLTYDPGQISESGTYGVRAEISAGGELLFTTTEAALVITQGRPTTVELVLSRVAAP